MQYRHLGSDGIRVSRLGLGTSTWGFTTDEDDAARQLRAFAGVGGTLVDTANGYSDGRAEEILGGLLGKVVGRDDIVLTTKGAGVPGKRPRTFDVTKAGLLAQIDDSLRRLGTDRVDLYQIHVWDARTPIEETLSALDEIVRSGRARAVGVCNYSGWQTAMAAQIQRFSGACPLSTTQVEYSLLAREVEREVVPAAQAHGMGVLAWAPIGRGVLSGKYRDGVPPNLRTDRFFNAYVAPHAYAERTGCIVETVVRCAEEIGSTPVAVAVRWVRDRPGVVAPLIGARNCDQLLASLEAERIDLPAEVTERLDTVSAIRIGYPERLGPAAPAA